MRQAKETLAALMQEEIALLELYLMREEELKKALFDRDWRSLDESIRLMNEAAGRIGILEEGRDRAFRQFRTELGVENGCGFYRAALTLPEPDRGKMTGLYRHLKLSAVRVRVRTAALDDYVREEQGTLRGIIGELFPERRGRTYSRTGESRENAAQPLVLNHTF
jgi:hypothetical protein